MFSYLQPEPLKDLLHFKKHFADVHYVGLQLPLATTVCTWLWQALLLSIKLTIIYLINDMFWIEYLTDMKC